MGKTQSISYVVIAMSFSGCGLVASGIGKAPNAVFEATQVSTASGGGGTPLEAFQSSFYAFARTNCVQCHGVSQSPLFAIADPSSAYNSALPYVDFSNPGNSTVVQYAGNGHCGVGSCTDNSSAALAAVNVWAAAANSTPSGGGSSSGSSSGASSAGLQAPSSAISYMTSALTIPANLPTAAAKPAIMRWPLSSLNPAYSALSGAYFEIQIQLLTRSIYRLTSPKLATPNGVNVTGIHVMIKPASQSGNGGEYPLGTAWTTIDEPVAAATIPNPLPTTSLNVPALSGSSVPMPVLSSSDQLIIGFEGLTSVKAATACRNLNGTNGFVTNVLPQMQNICFSCHLSGGAHAAFPMVNNNTTQLCATTLEYVDLANPSQSQIVLRPQGYGGHENLTGNFNPTPFIQWIQTE